MLRAVAIIALLSAVGQSGNHSAYRKVPCKTPELAPMCFKIHARLSLGNGTPSVRLWGIGTHHIYGIYSNKYGFAHDGETLDNESPELPKAVLALIPDTGGWTMYGDFDVCPLERHIEGHMQAACVAGALHVVNGH